MKQRFQKYALIWGILLAAFLAVVFLAKPLLPGFRISYDGRFWIALACVLIAFIGNLFCARLALREENKQKLFYKLPLLTVSRSALGTTLVLGIRDALEADIVEIDSFKELKAIDKTYDV